MTSENFEPKEEHIILFNKIKLTDYIATSIANYGEQCGAKELMDFLDLNCGAVPEGNFSQIIDISAPEQFLGLYTGIAQRRLAFAVINVLRLNEQTFVPIKQFCYEVGHKYRVEGIENLEQAYRVFQDFILEGKSGFSERNLIEAGEEKIVWEENNDFIKEIWEQQGGNLEIYNQIRECFVDGLLSDINVKLLKERDNIFSLNLNRN